MGQSEQRFSVITDRSLSELRKLINVPIEESLEPWCYEASRDSIRHWAHGIGDDNPLWCDPAYAAQTAHGRLQAPPSFIFTLNRAFSGYVGGMAGVHAMFAGIDVTWHQPLTIGDSFTTKVWLKELVEHETRFAGRSIQQIYRCEFYRTSGAAGGASRRVRELRSDSEDGILVAEGDSWCFRTERDAARERGTKYDGVKQKAAVHYSREDLAKIFEHYAAEEVRGATPRYIEEVKAGDKLPTIVKGPMTVTGFIAFAQGWGGLYIRANKLAWKQLQKHPGLGIANKFGIPDVPERVHWEDDLATLVGTPAAYDYGPERCSWMTHHLTNWIGDAGFLRRIEVKIRRHNPVGDTLYINGEVTRTFGEGGAHYAEIAQKAVNQDGELSVLATGVVRLPSRGGK
ncbi:MAG TPA: MaoC family dehydratase N-terminal domain-containing protein [Candidatus Binataceae bacterium]|nr:MaoC family dehydratase N-terminal domain-containing protein [Candidatus Binataceae bacterium]